MVASHLRSSYFGFRGNGGITTPEAVEQHRISVASHERFKHLIDSGGTLTMIRFYRAWFRIFSLVAGSLSLGACIANSGSPPVGVESLAKSSVACPCIYVTNTGVHRTGNVQSVAVYQASAKNDAAPIQYITGSVTGLYTPVDVAVDPAGNIYVADRGQAAGRPASVTVYAAGSTGNVAPIQTISGSNTLLQTPQGIALNPVNGDIYVANGPGRRNNLPVSITVYAPNANGNVAPLAMIKGDATQLNNPGHLRLDAAGNVYVPNTGSSGPASITVYAAGSSGNVAPIQTISGSRTQLFNTIALALDASSNVYAGNPYYQYGQGDSVTVYSQGSTGNAAPVGNVSGSNTLITQPQGVALDTNGAIYISNMLSNEITVYSPGSNGNVAPIRHIRGGNTHLDDPEGMTLR